MERRVLLAITLSFLVLFLFQRFVMPPPAPPFGAGGCNGCNWCDKCHGCTDTPGPGGTHGTFGTRSRTCTRCTGAPDAPGRDRMTVSEANAREIVVETTQSPSRVLEPRREARALDPEGVPQRRRRAARSRARRGILPPAWTTTDHAVHPHRGRSGDERAHQRGDLSRHGERDSRCRQG